MRGQLRILCIVVLVGLLLAIWAAVASVPAAAGAMSAQAAPPTARAVVDPALGQALDNSSLVWSTWGASTAAGGYRLWARGVPVRWVYAGPLGGTAAVSGSGLPPQYGSYNSYLYTSVQGPGAVGYWHDGTPSDLYGIGEHFFYIDGAWSEAALAADGHGSAKIESAGTHTFTWRHRHIMGVPSDKLGHDSQMTVDCVVYGRFLINGGRAYTNKPLVTITSNFTGPVTGMSFRERDSAHSIPGWQTPVPYLSTRGYRLVYGSTDGSKTLDCAFIDKLGGRTEWSEKVFLDTTLPTVSQLTSSTHPVEAIWYAGRNPSFAWTGQDPRQPGSVLAGSGIAGYSYLLDHSPFTQPDARIEGTAAAATFTGLSDGLWYFHVRAVDKAGNLSATATRAVHISATPVNVTSPTAASLWPSLSTQAIAWTISPGLGSGEFHIGLLSAAGVALTARQVLPVLGKTSYSAQVTAAVPAGSYRAYVYYRPTVGSGAWTAAATSAPFTVTPINVWSPTATSSWPSGSKQTITWTINPAAPAGGEFRLRLYNTQTKLYYLYQQVLPIAGKTSYSALVTAAVPAGSYKALVYYRPAVGSGSWTATGVSSAFKVTPINVTSPTAASRWKTGSTQSVTWTVNPAFAAGEFKVGFVDATGTKWYGGVLVKAIAGKTSYAQALKLTCPAGAGYKAYVAYRPTLGTGNWTLTARSAAFTVTP